MINAVVIEVDGQTRLLEMAEGNTLHPLQEAVGGYIELVRAAPTVDLWVNEEGGLAGLPVNRAATELLYELAPQWRGHDVLVGPVVVTGGDNGEGETLPVTQEMAQRLLSNGQPGGV